LDWNWESVFRYLSEAVLLWGVRRVEFALGQNLEKLLFWELSEYIVIFLSPS